MYIKHYTEIAKETWDHFVCKCRCAHTYFLYDMTALPMPRYLSSVYKNMSFGIFDDKDDLQFIFQLFVRVKKKKISNLFSRQRIELASFHGMCINDVMSAKQRKECKKCFENHMDSFYRNYKCSGLFIALPPFSDYSRPENINMMNPLIEWNFAPSLGYTYIIDLHKSDAEIFAGYAQTTRNLLNRIIKDNAYKIVKSDASQQDFESLCFLNDVCYKNQSTDKKLTKEYLAALWRVIQNQDYCNCYFLYESDRVLGYVILLSFKDTIYYFWGGGMHETQNAQRYLLHRLILESKKNGFKWFELGGALPWVRGGKDKSISDYKKSFGNTLHPIYKGAYQEPPK